MSRHRHDRVTDQPTPKAACAALATETVVRSTADLAEQYGHQLGRDVQDMFWNTDHHIERVEFLRIALIEAAEGLHPSRSLAGLAAALAPWIECGMGVK